MAVYLGVGAIIGAVIRRKNPSAARGVLVGVWVGLLLGVVSCTASFAVPSMLGLDRGDWRAPIGEPAAGPPPPNDSLIWQYDTGTEGEMVIVSPTVVQGVVYAGSYKGVYALDAETGELLWSFESESDLSPPPLVAGGVVFVEDLANLYALDAATGKELWRSEPSSFSVSGATVYQVTEPMSNMKAELSATDGRSGEKMWATNVSRSLPTAVGGNVYVSDNLRRVHALDSTTGKLVWSFDAGDVVQVPPTASNGVVFIRSYAVAYALDESTGEKLWSYEVDSAETVFPPVVVDGVWYLNDRFLRALDAATGQPLWSFEKGFVLRVYEVAEGMVFVSAAGAFHALDAATGEEAWSLGVDWDLSSIMVVDGVLYAHSLGGYLHTLDARTGEPIWSANIGYHWWQRPFAVSEGVVYVGYQGADSGIYAFTAPSGK